MWKQIKTPNLDPIVYQGGKILYDWYGWCLAVAQTMFGSQRTSPTAWSEWLNVVKYKHPDRNLPSGVYVPIWFSSPSGYGHVAIYKDGKVWSSPYTHKPYADVFNSIAEVERIYKSTYVGWSEDIGNTRVVEFVNNKATQEQIKALYLEILERPADPDGLKHYVNYTYDFVRKDLLASKEYKDLQAEKNKPKPEPIPEPEVPKPTEPETPPVSPPEPPTTPETPKPEPEPIPEPETPVEPYKPLFDRFIEALTRLIDTIADWFRK